MGRNDRGIVSLLGETMAPGDGVSGVRLIASIPFARVFGFRREDAVNPTRSLGDIEWHMFFRRETKADSPEKALGWRPGTIPGWQFIGDSWREGGRSGNGGRFFFATITTFLSPRGWLPLRILLTK